MAAPLTQTELARRVAAARDRAGKTQQEVADSLGIPRSAISLIENGERAISGIELLRFAQLLGVDVSDLVEGRDPESELVALFRMDPVLEQSDVQTEVREALRICRIASDLDEVLNEGAAAITYRESLPMPTTRTAAETQGRELARRHRERLGLGVVPIADVNALVIRQGVGVAEHELPDGVSGIFLSSAGQRPFILVNGLHKGARRRFSLAHEFCHAIVDNSQKVMVSRSDDEDNFRERRADTFASSFLLPPEAVLEHISRLAVPPEELNFTQVADLAARYGISYDATTVQLRMLGLVSGAKWQELRGEARRAAGYAHRKYPDRPATMVRISLREWAFGRMLRAFEQQLISRRKSMSIARELGYVAENVAASLDALTPSEE